MNSYIEMTLYLSVLVLVSGNAVIWYLTRRDLSEILNWISTLPGQFDRMQKKSSAALIVPKHIGTLMSRYGANPPTGTASSALGRRGSSKANSKPGRAPFNHLTEEPTMEF